MYTGKAKVSSKGWVVIPKDIRDAMGLEPGDEVQLFFWPAMKKDGRESGRLSVFRVPTEPQRAIAGKYKHLATGKAITDELIEEHRREVERDEREAREWRRKRKTSA